ncbi:nitroreductase family protein [Bacillus canaveralius]|uniref:Nitroreductase family protein n=1 Tax=Bacillus canaveralius TaxID=1403243 RepID=A0A2N5GSI3_9BACI|nr:MULTISPECIES: nitroreductase family protein [Bacillus]PLR80285.1 nitroreductase family protein [Bacillus sp. V33-4]PLR86728.1 nitroreductase family protein [Bacillus canaveralius]PLR92810.1 nitroreductase family protein [Bacillus canaveralius]RSK54680.1 nitroreductase family protein [Bacillus canaveralius]
MSASEQSLSTVIRERHSVRKYDPDYKISKEELEDILKEATLAPSSSNLQPWQFLVIQDEETKKELRAIANNQEQVETSSAVIAILGDLEMYENVEKVYRSAHEAGFMDEANMNRLIEGTNKTYPLAPTEVRANIASFDAGLVAMQLMLIAKARGYDTVPMGGFDKQKFRERFNVSDRYIPVVLIALGKAAEPAFQTTRLPLEDVVRFI